MDEHRHKISQLSFVFWLLLFGVGIFLTFFVNSSFLPFVKIDHSIFHFFNSSLFHVFEKVKNALLLATILRESKKSAMSFLTLVKNEEAATIFSIHSMSSILAEFEQQR